MRPSVCNGGLSGAATTEVSRNSCKDGRIHVEQARARTFIEVFDGVGVTVLLLRKVRMPFPALRDYPLCQRD